LENYGLLGALVTEIVDEQKEYLSQNFSGLDLSDRSSLSVLADKDSILTGKEFDDCTFFECNFSETIIRGSKFIDCLFIKCNLSVTKINQSKFSGVTFDECKMVGVDWTKASWTSIALTSPIKFVKCIINDSCFFGLSLSEIVCEECKAHDVDFREGDFSEANFMFTDFSNSLFSETNLTGADFTEATNYNINIYHNEIKRAKFSRYEAVRLLNSLDIELVD